MTYKDKTFCASKNCQNKCGRKMTEEEKKEVSEKPVLVCYSYFCGKPGENKHEL